MKKETESAQPTPSQSENELKRLRAELADERIKTEALSHRCIRLGEALDAALLAENNRTDKHHTTKVNQNESGEFSLLSFCM